MKPPTGPQTSARNTRRCRIDYAFLGSKSLFNDEELVPVKGQCTVLVPQSEVTYRVSSRPPTDATQPAGGAGPAGVGMNPRSDGIVIGNLQKRGNWSLEPMRKFTSALSRGHRVLRRHAAPG